MGFGGMIIKGDVLVVIKGGMKLLVGDKVGDKVKGVVVQIDVVVLKSVLFKVLIFDILLIFEDIFNILICKVLYFVFGLDSGCYCCIFLDFYLFFMCCFIKKYGFFFVQYENELVRVFLFIRILS